MAASAILYARLGPRRATDITRAAYTPVTTFIMYRFSA